MVSTDRRQVLQSVGVICASSLVSGCSFGSEGGLESGWLEIVNEDSESHTVTVTVQKVSDDKDDVPSDPVDKTPESKPISSRDHRFTVDADERRSREDFISEPGAYFVEARLDSGTTARGWIGLYQSAEGGVAEEYLEVAISGDEQMTVYAQQVGA